MIIIIVFIAKIIMFIITVEPRYSGPLKYGHLIIAAKSSGTNWLAYVLHLKTYPEIQSPCYSIYRPDLVGLY